MKLTSTISGKWSSSSFSKKWYVPLAQWYEGDGINQLPEGDRIIKKSSGWRRLGIAIAFLFVLVLWIIFQTDLQDSTTSIHLFEEPVFFPSEPVLPGFLINTDGCRIPDMDPFDSSVVRFIKNDTPLVCTSRPGLSPLVQSDLTSLYLDPYSLAARNLTLGQVQCCYQQFWREESTANLTESPSSARNVDALIRMSKECVKFEENGTAYVGDKEFVKVKCQIQDDTEGNKTEALEHKDFHSFAPFKGEEGSQLDPNKVNVLILGVDSVSRLNLLRQMPLTVRYLRDELRAVEMLGYNKVGDNTFPNLVPAFTGMTEEELGKTCWPEPNSIFDHCPFVWDRYKKNGYLTCFAEDSTWMGVFNYLKTGFQKQPTDYYWRPFEKKAEEVIGWERRQNANLCLGERIVTTVLLDYAEKFSRSVSTRALTFAVIWGTSLTHDSLNLPSQGDRLHRDLLRRLHRDVNGLLDRTVLIVMSDHGIRWGGIRATYQGHIEERLPFLYFVFPRWFKRRYTTAVGNLYRNAHKLTTPFDLYETLVDLVNPEGRLNADAISQRLHQQQAEATIPRGISLFLPISGARTCSDAGITPHWCTCHHSDPVAPDHPNVVEAASRLATGINDLLGELVADGRCAALSPAKVFSARVEQTLPQMRKSDKGLQDYVLQVEMSPGGGTFEATVRHNTDNTYAVIGQISRTNLYGNQSSCLTNYRLRLYCFCIDNPRRHTTPPTTDQLLENESVTTVPHPT